MKLKTNIWDVIIILGNLILAIGLGIYFLLNNEFFYGIILFGVYYIIYSIWIGNVLLENILIELRKGNKK